MVNFKINKLSAASILAFLGLHRKRNSNLWLGVKILLFVILVKLRNALTEGKLNIQSILGTDLKISQSMFLLEKLLCLLLTNLSVFQVAFISQNHKMKIILWPKISFGKKLIPPFDDLIESLSVCQIEHQKTTITSLIKDIKKSPEFLLSSSVPNSILKLHIIDGHFMGKLICPNSDSILSLKLLIYMSINN